MSGWVRSCATLPKHLPCWSCIISPNKTASASCSACKKIAESPEKAYFDVFKFPKKFGIDLDELQARFRDIQKEVHPDGFTTGSPEDRKQSLELSTFLNVAHKKLQCPFERSEYLLMLDEKDLENHKPDIELLMQVMEMRTDILKAENAADMQRLKELRVLFKTYLDESIELFRKTYDEDKDIEEALEKACEMRYRRRNYDATQVALEGGDTIPIFENKQGRRHGRKKDL